jgi:glucosamine--fructose-6-phosphate aminotransferase (isomerizing)
MQYRTKTHNNGWSLAARGYRLGSIKITKGKIMSKKNVLASLFLVGAFAFVSPANATHMASEINEQPQVCLDTAKIFYNDSDAFSLPQLPIDPAQIKRIKVVACGTSYHAGLVSEEWFEKYVGVPVHVSVASEFSKKRLLEDPLSTLLIFISQSGTTTHTLEALTYAKAGGYKSISIVNSEKSPIGDASDLAFITRAGKEISVAATKSFTTQLSVLAHLAVGLGLKKNTIPQDQAEQALTYLKADLALEMKGILSENARIEKLGKLLATKKNMFVLGSGSGLGMAREAALKLKETSYFITEALPEGELKQGPLAMLDENSVVLIVGTNDITDKQLRASLNEIQKRKAGVILLADLSRQLSVEPQLYHAPLPATHPDFSVITWALSIQQIALARSLALGLNPDEPRDLVKAVVTE